MRCTWRSVILVGLATACVAAAAACAAAAEGPSPAGRPPKTDAPQAKDEAKAPEEPEKVGEAAPPSKPQETLPKTTPPRKLGEAAAALRDRVRRTIARYSQQPLNTGDNSAAEIVHVCLAFGCDAEVRYGSAASNPLNAVGCLCYGYPCAGYQLLVAGENPKVMARVGYGLQEHPSEMLAVLAQAAVPADYEIRLGKYRGTVADLVEAEKLTCLPGDELAHKLIGLAFYVRSEEGWKDLGGREWTVEKVLEEELNRSPATDRCDVAHHLMSLSYAVERRARAGKPLEGPYRRAQKYVAEFQDFAFSLQNREGGWHPGFFALRGTSRDVPGLLRSTGHVLEWLAFSLPEDRLSDPRVVKSVSYVADLLGGESYAGWSAATTTPREIDSVAHALHALRIYDRRAFEPFDAPPAKKPTPSQAKAPRSGQGSAKTR